MILIEELEYDQLEAATNAGGFSAYNPDERVNGALVRAGSGPGLELPHGVRTLSDIRESSAQVHEIIAQRLGTARWQAETVNISAPPPVINALFDHEQITNFLYALNHDQDTDVLPLGSKYQAIWDKYTGPAAQAEHRIVKSKYFFGIRKPEVECRSEPLAVFVPWHGFTPPIVPSIKRPGKWADLSERLQLGRLANDDDYHCPSTAYKQALKEHGKLIRQKPDVLEECRRRRSGSSVSPGFSPTSELKKFRKTHFKSYFSFGKDQFQKSADFRTAKFEKKYLWDFD